MIDSFTAVEDEDKMIAVFREDGTFRYYDFPPEEYYDGTYSYDEASGVLVTDDGIEKQSCRAEITVSDRKLQSDVEISLSLPLISYAWLSSV